MSERKALLICLNVCFWFPYFWELFSSGRCLTYLEVVFPAGISVIIFSHLMSLIDFCIGTH